MELRKQIEIEYYDKRAQDSEGDFEGFNSRDLGSFKFCYELLEKYCKDKIILDYGCGNGVHAGFLAGLGAKKVIGIDLSGKSLEIARKRESRVEFLKMDFFLHNFKDGIWAVYPLKFVKVPFKLRHYIPLIFVLGLLGTGLLGIFFPIFFWLFLFIIGLYFLVSIYSSFKIMMGEKDFRYLFVMPIVFASRHIGYGLGSVFGLIKLLK